MSATMNNTPRVIPGFPRSMAGVSLVELMIAMLLGLMILAGLVTIFANSSRSREEIERASRQIENGRYAMETLADDLRLAGFYGELNVNTLTPPNVLPDPCSTDPAVWTTAVPVHIQGYDNGAGLPACILAAANFKPNTDVLVIRRAATCEAGAPGCSGLTASLPYVQVSKCASVPPELSFVLNTGGSGVHTLRLRNCLTTAGRRQYLVRVYFISTDNGAVPPVAIPTLKRLDFDGVGFTVTPLVEGIEELNFEYGVDWRGPLGVADPPDGKPEGYTADPNTYADAGCVTCANPGFNWANVVTARISLLARNIDPSPGYTDAKTYTVGRDAANAEITVTPGGPYRRHAYSGLVRIVNAAERRDRPS